MVGVDGTAANLTAAEAVQHLLITSKEDEVPPELLQMQPARSNRTS